MPDQHERYYCEGRLGMVSAGNNTSACRDCGAVVLDTEAHDKWHDRQDRTAMKAGRTDRIN